MQPAAATRLNDNPAFNAGGLMFSPSTFKYCSTGFAIRINGVTHTTTARHCDKNDFETSTEAYAYGTGTNTPDGAARYMSERGSNWMFDGAWNDSSGYKKTVINLVDVGVGGEVCTSGAYSGVHCGIEITSIAFLFNDGYGDVWVIRGRQKFGTIAASKGDSGGPVFTISGDSYVRADGMIQGIGNTTLSDCGSVVLPGPTCSAEVGFTAMRTIINATPGATLVTGS